MVRLYQTTQLGLYASRSYIAQNGLPDLRFVFGSHHFIGVSGAAERAPFSEWMSDLVADDQITFVANQLNVMDIALRAGGSIGFAPVPEAETDTDTNLVPIGRPNPDWQIPVGIVTHVDLHRSIKVQAFLKML